MIKHVAGATRYSLISRSHLLVLSVLNPYKSLGVLFNDWLIIVSAIVLHSYYPDFWIYILVWLLIGSRMYALYSLLHDGIHYLLFPQRQVNDWLCRIFLALPLFADLDTMRKRHLAHHKYLQTPNDPEQTHLSYNEFQFPQSISILVFTFIKDITGINYMIYKLRKVTERLFRDSYNKKISYPQGGPVINRHELFAIVYYLFFMTLIIQMGWLWNLIIYWVIPYVTVYQVLNRLRLSTEHFNLSKEKIYETRTVSLNMIEGFLLSPHNLGYHTEHHLFPSVPFYRLPSLHRQLMQKEQYHENAIVNYSYLDVVKQYVKQ